MPPAPPGVKPSGGASPQGNNLGAAAVGGRRVSQSFALQQTMDSGDAEPPRIVSRPASPPATGSLGVEHNAMAAAVSGPRGAGAVESPLDQTSDGSSGSSGDGGAAARGSVVSVGGDTLVGTVLGDRYRLEMRVGEGGMGVVYQAEHLALKTKVAVKVLVRSAGEISRKRFLLEAQMASKVRHPNVVYLADYGLLPDGRPYLVMEFLRGPTLADALRSGRMAPLRACRIAVQIARGMQTVHDQGIVHRDLKPSNIFLLPGDASVGQEDFVKIVDFGVAKDTTAPAKPPEIASDGAATAASSGTAPRDQASSLGASLTRADAQIGTPQYMAPEQIDGGIVDARTDQYAFGCILYRMLTGVLPFMADTAEAVMRMHVEAPVVPPRQRVTDLTISDGLENLVLRCLSKHAEDRFASMSELAFALQQYIDDIEGRSLSLVISAPSNAASASGWMAVWRRTQGRARVILATALGLGLVVGVVATLALRRVSSVSKANTPARLSAAEVLSLRQRALKLLLANVQATSPELRGSACVVLGRASEQAARPAIIARLEDSVPEVRGQAALALARLGDAASVGVLRRLIEPEHTANVRVAAAAALAQLGDEQGSRFLRQALGAASAGTGGTSGASSDLRLRAAFLLCEQGDLRAVELLSSWLDRRLLPAALQGNALGCLAQASVASAQRQLLARMQSDAAMEDRIAAAARLVKVREPQALAFLRQLGAHPGPHQLLAARALAFPGESTGVSILRSVLQDSTAAVPARVLSAEGLGQLGQLDDLRLLGKHLDALPAEDDMAPLRHAIAAAIVDVSQSDPAIMSAQSLSWARSALGDTDWVVRSEALLVLAESEQADDLQRIDNLISDSDARVRRSVVRALGRRRDISAISSLRQALADPEVSVRQEAWASLGRLAKSLGKEGQSLALKEGRRALEQETRNRTEEEQVIARTTLLGVGDAEQRAAVRKLADSSDARTRELVGEYGKSDPELLRKLLNDRVFAVRFAAAQRLAEQGDKSSAAVLREGLGKTGIDGVRSYLLLRRLGELVAAPADPRVVLSRGSVDERIQLVRSLASLPDDLVRSTLLQAARDRELGVRRAVVDVAETLLAGDSREAARAALSLLASDSSRGLRARAAMLLSSLPPEFEAPQSARSASADAASTTSERSTDDAGTTGRDEPTDGGTPAPADVPDETNAPGSESETSSPADSAAQATNDRVLKAAESSLQAGQEAAERQDYKRAIKHLARAATSCSKSKGAKARSEGCSRVMYEAAYSMGRIYGAQGRFADAATEYERARALQSRTRQAAHGQDLARALSELKSKLGTVLVASEHKGRCRKRVQWLPPGRHMVKIGRETRLVTVSAGQQSEVGQCP